MLKKNLDSRVWLHMFPLKYKKMKFREVRLFALTTKITKYFYKKSHIAQFFTFLAHCMIQNIVFLKIRKNVSLNLTSLDWPRADIMLVSLSHGEKLDMSENILLGGYTEDKSQMVLVKIFGDLVDPDQKVLIY